MKIINIVLGVATAIILGALINLGIAAFYPAPVAPTYPNTPAVVPSAEPCASGDVACLQANEQAEAQATAAQDQFNNEETVYENAMSIYDRNIFIIANIIGIIVFAIAFFLVFGDISIAARGVPIGIMLAGLWSIMYGYARGWGSVDDMLKFFIGLVIALLVIGGSTWLVQRDARKASVAPRGRGR